MKSEVRAHAMEHARGQAARRAVAICRTADEMAHQAVASVGVDDDRLFSLLEQREQMLADLAEQLVVLRFERPTADSPMYAATERMVDEADALVSEVCEALTNAQRATMTLAVRVTERAAELRSELAEVQRAANAGMGYSAMGSGSQVDRVR